MKFLKNRVLPFVCTFLILVSLLVAPVSAADPFPSNLRDTGSVGDWNARLHNDNVLAINMLAGFLQTNNTVEDVFWHIVDPDLGNCCGEVDRQRLEEIAASFNYLFDRPIGETFAIQAVEGAAEILYDTLAWVVLGEISPHFVVTYVPSLGVYRILEENMGIFLVNSAGAYPYVVATDDGTAELVEDQWLPMSALAQKKWDLTSYEALYNTANALDAKLVKNAEFWVIKKNFGVAEYVLGNSNGLPYAARYEDDKWASNQERPTTNVTENGDIVEGDLVDNSVNLDLEGMTMLVPGGTLAFIDQIIYDESTKSYHIDSHDTYNYTVNNHYTWNYYINYTSITYIGQTEEYNKYYEVYYELPDGRDSADLTKEDLEQLNLSIDVIPYGRSADDTSLRSLYHFDGDTKDSSYWNYCTDFTWNKGASLTYMDAGVFDGALYLDETEHQFTMTLPSNIGSADFTLQFRYYQSATAAPVTDSSLKIGDGTIFQMDGAHFKTASGTAIAPISIGNWQEVCLMRSDGTLRLYHNGLPIFTYPVHANYTGPLGDTITFTFGSEQQTFKYFDEFRFINKAVYDAESYEPSSVPHDTNLTLVLPDTAVPVADEYWSFKNDEQTNILSQYNLDVFYGTQNATNSRFKYSSPSYDITMVSKYYGFTGYLVDARYSGFSSVNASFPNFVNVKSYSPLSFNDSGMSMEYTNFPSTLSVAKMAVDYSLSNYLSNFKTRGIVPSSGLFSVLAYNNGQQIHNLPAGDYTFSLVTDSGDTASVTFDIPSSMYSSVYAGSTEFGTAYNAVSFTSTQVGGYEFGLMLTYCDTTGNGDLGPVYLLFVRPVAVDSVTESIVYMELVEGSETALEAEWVESVTAIDKADLNTPTLAVRTDIDITSYQIGGVRPSIPEKGQVWAMVENDRIVSIQIYNGQAWEGVDGRIWTGQRWIPASSYNIITLQDMYDIVDATPNYEYIYSEAGFWAWWQKSWNAFQERLFQALGSGGSGGGSIVPGTVKQEVSEALSSLIEGIFGTITEVLKSLIGAASDLLSGIFSFFSDTVFGGIRDFFSSFDELINPFETTIENEDGSTTTTPGLPDDVVTGLGFFSGLIMLIPDEVRVVLFFFAGLTLFIAILKRFA